ncbi:hypothetical protein FJZ18_00085 [Candidatus Pacearchaeota archaeon]|nr:hypothetical protein [Candidatus Pacearchaeota archaeon]
MQKVQLQKNIFDEYVQWKYGSTYVVAMLGKCDLPLKEWSQACNGLSLEFADAIEQSNIRRTFLPMFAEKGALDITAVTTYRPVESSIVIYGVEKEPINTVLDAIRDRVNFQPRYPGKRFVSSLEGEVRMRTQFNYSLCMAMAANQNVSLECVFAALHYSRFITYTGLTQLESINQASLRFNLPLLRSQR